MTKEFGGKREMSIRAALEWAFGVEHAQLDFDELAPEGDRPGTSTIYRMIQQGALGCQIDGGGRSRPADDAEVIANAVAALPVALGGKPMACDIAAWARAGAAPDWMPDAKPRCVPQAWRNTRHGHFAQAEVVRKETLTYRGKKREYDVYACPITYTPTAQQIAMARRRYLNWYGALLHLRYEISIMGLTRIDLINHMPPSSPWVPAQRSDHQAA